jgi:hypothetical protein
MGRLEPSIFHIFLRVLKAFLGFGDEKCQGRILNDSENNKKVENFFQQFEILFNSRYSRCKGKISS